MKIQFVSDLHLERCARRPYPATAVFAPANDRDVLVLAGDIGEADDAWPFISRELTISPVIYVAGNHEYWTRRPRCWFEEYWKGQARANQDFHYLHCEKAAIGGVRFFGAPWYSDLFGRRGHDFLNHVSAKVHDFNPKWNLGEWTVQRHLEEHARQTEAMRAQRGKVDVVVTHWPATLEATQPHFRGGGHSDNPMMAYYLNDHAGLVKEIGAQVWISGHLHDAHDYSCGKTRCVSNSPGAPNVIQPRAGYSNTRTIAVSAAVQ